MPRRDPSGRGDAALLAALVQGKSLSDAASTSGVSESTVKRRLADPRFQRELQAARQRAVSRAVSILAEGTTTAAVNLRWLASNAAQESVRLAAARSILEYAFRGIETMDLAERIRALEAEREHRWGA